MFLCNPYVTVVIVFKDVQRVSKTSIAFNLFLNGLHVAHGVGMVLEDLQMFSAVVMRFSTGGFISGKTRRSQEPQSIEPSSRSGISFALD